MKITHSEVVFWFVVVLSSRCTCCGSILSTHYDNLNLQNSDGTSSSLRNNRSNNNNNVNNIINSNDSNDSNDIGPVESSNSSVYSRNRNLRFNFTEFFNDNKEQDKLNKIGKRSKRIGNDDRYPQDIFFTKDTCPTANEVTSTLEPECTVLNNVPGAWVCRTLYDTITGVPRTFTSCVDTNRFLPTDTCGCCNGICPDPCLCQCDLIMDGDKRGVLVNGTQFVDINTPKNNEEEDIRCVDPYRAYRLITGPGFLRQPKCVTECPVPANSTET